MPPIANAELPIVVARERFANRRLEGAHRVVAHVAHGAAPESRQPIDLGRLPLRKRFAKALPGIHAELLLDLAVHDSLEAVGDPADNHLGRKADEAIPRPLFATDHALEQIAAGVLAEGCVRKHGREAIGDDLAVHRDHRRAFG